MYVWIFTQSLFTLKISPTWWQGSMTSIELHVYTALRFPRNEAYARVTQQ